MLDQAVQQVVPLEREEQFDALSDEAEGGNTLVHHRVIRAEERNEELDHLHAHGAHRGVEAAELGVESYREHNAAIFEDKQFNILSAPSVALTCTQK